MKLTRWSIAQLSRQGIGWSSQPTENCHPSIRSTVLPIYPVWTLRHLLPQGEKGHLHTRLATFSSLHRALVVETILVVLDDGGDGLQRELAFGVLHHVLQIEALDRD